MTISNLTLKVNGQHLNAKMVKLTMDLIARGSSGYIKKRKDESLQQYIGRLTHVYLENKSIDTIGDDLSCCHNLIVLYLYDNQLNCVPKLSSNCSLTHLYLQNNNISKLENLSALSCLQKLYVGGNAITVVEGLDRSHQLQELHIENQHLPQGEQLLFDPRSLSALAENLQVLNVSGNNLLSIRELEQLPRLTQLLSTDNQLTDMKELAHLLSVWQFLWRLDLARNPVCQQAKYKDQIIVMGKQLEVLDGKSISDTARQFLLNWQASRELTRKKTMDSLMRQDTLTESVFSGAEGRPSLPLVHSASTRQTSTSAYLLPDVNDHPCPDHTSKPSVQICSFVSLKSSPMMPSFLCTQESLIPRPVEPFARSMKLVAGGVEYDRV